MRCELFQDYISRIKFNLSFELVWQTGVGVFQETELLDYIDAEQLPPLLVDLLDKAQVCFRFYFFLVVLTKQHFFDFFSFSAASDVIIISVEIRNSFKLPHGSE